MDELLKWLPILLLVSCRVAGMTAVSPVFANPFFSVRLRGAFTFLLAVLIVPAAHAAPGATEGAGMLVACVIELAIGLVMGFMGQMVFAAVQMAGALLDLDMGFSMAQIMDPVSGRSDPIMASFFQTLALVMYLALNAHHLLIRGLATSYETIAAGALTFSQPTAMQMVEVFGVMLAIAVQMVLPFMAAMLIATAALGGINRAVPQMQVFGIGMGIKTVAGMAMLLLLLPHLPGFLQALFAKGHTELIQILGLRP